MHPGVVTAGITNIVVSTLCIILAVMASVSNARPLTPFWWERDNVRVYILLPFDYIGGLLGVIGSAILVHHATDRLALVKRAPFGIVLILLTLSMAAFACSFALTLVEECSTNTRQYWWSWQDDANLDCGGQWQIAIVRGVYLIACAVTFISVAIVHRRPPPAPSPATADITNGAISTVSASSASDSDGIALTSTTPGSSPSLVSTTVTADAELGVAVTDVKKKPTNRRRVGGGAGCSRACCQLWALCTLFWVLCAVLIPTLVYTRLRRPCECYEGEVGPEWRYRRFCFVPEGVGEMPPLPTGVGPDNFTTFSDCDAFAMYLRASACPRQNNYWSYSRPVWGLTRTFGGEEPMFAMAAMEMDAVAEGAPVLAAGAVARSAPQATSSTASGTAQTGSTFSGDAGGGSSGGSGMGAPSFSETNVQVQGVDEADIVKTDGTYLYTITPSAQWSREATLNIVRTWPVEQAALVSSTELSEAGVYGISPTQLFLDGDHLLVIGSQFHEGVYGDSGSADASSHHRWRHYQSGMTTVRMLLFDVSNRAAPRLTRVEEVEGSYVAARKVSSMVYVVANAQPIYPSDTSTAAAVDELMPLKRSLLGPTNIATSTTADFEPVGGGCAAVGYVPSVRARSLIVVASLDMASYSVPMRTTVVTGRGANIYASSRSLYVASPASWRNGGRTIVIRFSLNNGAVAYAGIVPVPGYILNQWAMDEHRASAAGGGAVLSGASGVTFRIVTTTTWSAGDAQASHLYTYAVDVGSGAAGATRGDGVGLTPLGSLSGLAPGERVYAVRFMGERLYVVTFRQVDPLFVIDLTVPAAPVLLGELKVPGYSDYLHPVNRTHLIGIGKDATDQGRVLGMKMALFDASNPTAPAESYSITLGDRQTHSSALDDHRAFAYDAERRLLTLPVRLYLASVCPCESGRSYGTGCSSWPDVVWQGAVVWRVGEASFELQGMVPHYDPSAARAPPDNGGSLYYDTLDSPAPTPTQGPILASSTSSSTSPPPPPPLTPTASTSTPVGAGSSTPADAGSGGLPMCTRYSLPSCAGSMSTSVARAIYISDDVLYTLSPSLVRADSLALMANLTRDAIALTTTASSSPSTTAAAQSAWEAAFDGSRLAAVDMPHSPCDNGRYPPISIMPVPLETRVDAASRAAAPSNPASVRSSSPPCECACTSECNLGRATTLRAASALL